MRRMIFCGWLVFVIACDGNGTVAQPTTDAGGDVTLGDAGGGDAADATEEVDGGLACTSIAKGNPYPSQDCVYAGSCPESCAQGTSAAYACNAASVPVADGGVYPSAFAAPSGIVSIVAYDSNAYPWDAGAFVSCAPLTCVRWATADHVGGGSAWPADPCGGDAGDPLAWVCPPVPGVLPPADAGCTSAGDLNSIGGANTGAPLDAVWCCPGAPLAEGGAPDAAPADGSSDQGEDASAD